MTDEGTAVQSGDEGGPVAVGTDVAGVAVTGMNHVQLAALTLVLAGVLVLGAALGTVPTAVAVAVVQAVLVPGWVLGNALPGRIGAIVLGVLAAAGADAVTLHWPGSGYSPVLGVLGVAVPLMFAHQLTRGVVRTRVVESLAGITVLVLGVVAVAGLNVLRHAGDGRAITLALTGAYGLGLVAAHLTDAVLPSPRFDPAMDRGLPAVIAGVVVGGAVGYLGLRNELDFAGGRSVFVGAAVAAVACLLSIGISFAESRAIPPVPETAETVGGPAEAGDGTGEAAVGTDGTHRLTALRPAGAVALTLTLAVPAAYVLADALTS